MPKFGKRSLEQIEKADIRIILILNKAIEFLDITVLESHRKSEDQERMFNDGKSKLHFPHSKHNHFPSKAVDIAPYPIDWKDHNRFYFMGGVIQGIAHDMGIKIRWGGDWNRNNDFKDQTFFDLPHIEVLD